MDTSYRFGILNLMLSTQSIIRRSFAKVSEATVPNMSPVRGFYPGLQPEIAVNSWGRIMFQMTLDKTNPALTRLVFT